MIFISFNVNGLRSIAKKGFGDWPFKTLPDVIALQEIKAFEKNLVEFTTSWSEFYEVHLYPAEKAGYSGTALFILKSTKHKVIAVNKGIGIPDFDHEGRLIWAEFDDFIFFNGYFPNGRRDHSRVDFKCHFSKKVMEFALDFHHKTGKEIIITGDINTAHGEIDLAHPKANINTTGFLKIERAFIDEMITNGFIDAFRYFHPGKKDQYTWWSYRFKCREKNVGWRLDYFFVTSKILSKIVKVEHLTSVFGSDHCPILLEIN